MVSPPPDCTNPDTSTTTQVLSVFTPLKDKCCAWPLLASDGRLKTGHRLNVLSAKALGKSVNSSSVWAFSVHNKCSQA